VLTEETAMSLRRLLFVLIALCVSGTTVLIGRAWMTPREIEAAPTVVEAGAHVLVAQATLAAGQFVRAENLRWQAWPTDGVASSYIVEGKGRIEDFVGAVVRSALSEGEPVTESRLVRPGDRGFLAAVLTPGDRAVTVTVTVSSGLAGFVFPGDRVDLLLTMAVQPENAKIPRHAAETLLTDLRVLAVDQRMDDQNKEVVVAKTATLEVTPKQAETIAVATELGNLSLSLRSLASTDGAGDGTPAYSHTWDSEATHLIGPPDLHQNDPTPPPKAPVETTMKVTVVRGTEAKLQEFGKGTP
jgi:pilus assembly protein CpaB